MTNKNIRNGNKTANSTTDAPRRLFRVVPPLPRKRRDNFPTRESSGELLIVLDPALPQNASIATPNRNRTSKTRRVKSQPRKLVRMPDDAHPPKCSPPGSTRRLSSLRLRAWPPFGG